ncbi:MAG: hypothetical protein NC079_04535 [Clostridium sp.]|nr:hypothetical protein [Acetatifactor muris]MCM1526325.1 hypothetical protein [Bacteroides sp.]MCM1562858.1 hypothetical protein [Clostridium sp.]
MNETGKTGKKNTERSGRVSAKAVRRLASGLYRADRRRNITAIAAIALSSMMVVLVLSTALSIVTLTGRQKQMLLGTRAEGIYKRTSYHWFEELRDSGYFDDTGMVVYMGHYESAARENVSQESAAQGSSTQGDEIAKSRNWILYAEEKTASWNFNELLEGRWAESDGEAVVDEHFVENYGGDVRVGDRISLHLETPANSITQEVTVTGICAANDALDEARIYMSEEFFLWDRSGLTIRTYCRFEGGRYREIHAPADGRPDPFDGRVRRLDDLYDLLHFICQKRGAVWAVKADRRGGIPYPQDCWDPCRPTVSDGFAHRLSGGPCLRVCDIAGTCGLCRD